MAKYKVQALNKRQEAITCCLFRILTLNENIYFR